MRRAAAREDRSRMARIRAILWWILVLNVAVAAAKFFYGVATGSLSMRTDGIASAFDALSNVVGLAGVAVASRPADRGHPYGHAKFETYASLAIGGMLAYAAVSSVTAGVQALLGAPDPVRVDAGSYLVMFGTLAVNIGVSVYEAAAGKRLRSEVLVADAHHTRSDALVSISVIVGLVLVQFGLTKADAAASIIVGVAIAFSAWEVLRAASATLSDEARLPVDEVRSCAMAVPDVRSVHSIRTRGTEGEVFADLHVLVDPMMPVWQAHDVADQVEGALKARFSEVSEVMVHIEPDTVSQRVEERRLNEALDQR